MLAYRLTSDLLYIGEAASKLLESNKKPKACSSPLLENNVTWNEKPNKLNELKPMDESLRANLAILRAFVCH